MSARPAVVVTGASSGIGAAAVVRLAAAGYAVFGSVRNAEDAARLEAERGVRALRFDVTDAPSIALAARTIAESGHSLAAVVNNAGIAVAGPLEYLPLDDFRRQLEVNVVGSLAVTQAFLPLLRASRGRVVFVGSVSGRLTAPFIAPYGTSKSALRALASALRVELAPMGVRVVLLEPGSVRTPIWGKGQRSADALRSTLSAGALAEYGATVDALIRLAAIEERTGLPAVVVANAIVRAIASPRPRPEQLIGLPARLGSLVALLPHGLRDRAIVRAMRLPRR